MLSYDCPCIQGTLHQLKSSGRVHPLTSAEGNHDQQDNDDHGRTSLHPPLLLQDRLDIQDLHEPVVHFLVRSKDLSVHISRLLVLYQIPSETTVLE